MRNRAEKLTARYNLRHQVPRCYHDIQYEKNVTINGLSEYDYGCAMLAWKVHLVIFSKPGLFSHAGIFS